MMSEVDREVVERYLMEIGWSSVTLEENLVSSKISKRSIAIKTVLVLQLESLFDLVINQLDDPQYTLEDQSSIADLIGIHSNEVAIHKLVAKLEAQSTLDRSKMFSARALGRTFNPLGVAPLRRELFKVKNIQIICTILESLGMLTAVECEQEVQRFAMHDSPCVRFWACYALGEIGAEDSLSIVEGLLEDNEICESQGAISSEALSSLERMNMRILGNLHG